MLTRSMDIYAKRGARVVFAHPQAGTTHSIAVAASHLKAGEAYTVDLTLVGPWETAVYLHEFPGTAFNSVSFVDAPLTYLRVVR